jgi:diguanylate cyclase (GGDEF)-like protein/PAS domain S-box-containing protein
VTVLIVENEPGIRDRVRDQLQDQGVQVTVAATRAAARDAVGRGSFSVVIVDLALPDGSGLDVLDSLRRSGSAAHVIVLSASTSEADRVRAFDRGADDYVVKPVFVRELTARVLAVRRRRDPRIDACLQVGRLRIDLKAREVVVDGRTLELTAKEFDLLAYLAARPGYVFSRDDLLKAVWHSASDWQQAATVTEHIRRLRLKIEDDPRRPRLIRTVRGSGYRLDLPADGVEKEWEAVHGPPAVESGVIIHVDGRIVFADRAAEAILGGEEQADLLGRHLFELVAPRSQDAVRNRMAVTDAGHALRSELMDIERADGTQVSVEVASNTVDWHGQRAGRVSVTHLPEGPSRLRRLVTGVLSEVTEAVIITDLHFHVRSWNAAAERLYGWAEQEVLGRHVLDILHWVGDEGEFAAAWESLELKGRWNGEGRQSTRDGSVVSVLATTTLLRDEAGAPVGIVSVNRLTAAAGHTADRELAADEDAKIRRGITNHEFEVYYQPVVGLDDLDVITLEALLRWNHPERGLLTPVAFLDAAERSGVIIELGHLVLEEACGQAAEWRRAGADIELSVNLSTRQLSHPGLVDQLLAVLATSGLDPAVLWLEVTETALVEELEKASLVLHRLAELGVRVAIDDFGTGWACLTYLRSFPVHALKIDGSFVAGVGHNPNDTAIVRSILSVGAELDLLVIAEGIETAAQQKALQQLGCPVGQGYLYGRPTRAQEAPVQRARRLDPTTGGTTPEVQHADLAHLVDVPSQPGAALVAATARTHAQLSPTLRAAGSRRTGALAQRLPTGPSPVGVASERIELDAVANLLRGLLRVRSAHGAADLLHETIRRMGGTLVSASDAGDDALPIDVSLGEAPPILVEVERFTVARMQLERLLPRLLEDARQAVDLLRQTERLQEETTHDGLTGLANRRVLDRVIPRANSGVVVMIDLDHFKEVNDHGGHAAGDAVLSSFGLTLARQVRAVDTSCRVGGDEFAIIVADADVRGALKLIERIRAAWAEASPQPVTFSAGVATVCGRGGTSALLGADGALYRAKALGRNRTEVEPEPTDADK